MSDPPSAPEKPTGIAANAVFDVTEVLEMILLHLPYQDLLSATRVSRTFQATINHSLLIQRHLFLKPTPGLGGNFKWVNWLLYAKVACRDARYGHWNEEDQSDGGDSQWDDCSTWSDDMEDAEASSETETRSEIETRLMEEDCAEDEPHSKDQDHALDNSHLDAEVVPNLQLVESKSAVWLIRCPWSLPTADEFGLTLQMRESYWPRAKVVPLDSSLHKMHVFSPVVGSRSFGMTIHFNDVNGYKSTIQGRPTTDITVGGMVKLADEWVAEDEEEERVKKAKRESLGGNHYPRTCRGQQTIDLYDYEGRLQ